MGRIRIRPGQGVVEAFIETGRQRRDEIIAEYAIANAKTCEDAILAERERCAKIALAIGYGISPAKGITVHTGTAEAIADAIRKSE